MDVICPLCESKNVTCLEIIQTSDLLSMYNNWLKDDISAEFGAIKEIGFYRCNDSDLRFFSPLICGSESFYEKLQQFSWYYMDEKEEYDYAATFIRDGDDVLEIGCGKGAFSEKINCNSYLGLEFSQRAMAEANKRGIRVVNQMIQEHACQHREVYDVVCAFQVLEHVNDLNSFIQSSLLCLKPGGFLVYSVPSYDSFVRYSENGLLDMPPHHVTKWSDQALLNVARIFNLDVVALEHEQLSDIHIKWYSETMALHSLKSIFRLKHKLINKDTSRFLGYIKKFSFKLANLYEDRLVKAKTRPFGHSVTIVYKKRF